jgi:rRNA biogenesis protein RRP5
LSSLKDLVKQAADSTDAERIYIHFGQFVSEQKPDHADEAWEFVLKRCKGSLSVWNEYFRQLMKEKKFEEARKGFKRAHDSFKTQDAAKTWDLKKDFAVLEFRNGNMEHGRTMFDDLLREKPKRSDFWLVYAAMEGKYGDEDHARMVFDRAAKMRWNRDVARLILKKWVEFEQKHGSDRRRLDYIKQIAEEYREREEQ